MLCGLNLASPAQSSDSSFIVHAASSDSAASPTTSPEVTKPFDMITDLPGDYARWGAQTASASNLPTIGFLAATTIMSMSVDHQVYASLDHQYGRSASFRSWSQEFVMVGNGLTSVGIAAVFAAYGAVGGDSRAMRTASEIVEATLAVGGAVQVLKHISGREFPAAATRSTGRWTFFPNQIKYFSNVAKFGAFPSGHLSTATATLTVIQENYPTEQWISYIGYPVLGGLAMGLTSTGLHWISDFPLALALGYSFGRVVAHHKDAASTEERGGMHANVTPMVFPNGVMGMELAMAW